jgi:CubicO group peptidase (beta-lactamase class C family)
MNDTISRFIGERIAANDFPSAVYLVAEKGEIVFQDALGYAVVEPEQIEAKIDTIYDVASLTKPLVTGLLLAKLIESGRFGFDDDISDIQSSNREMSLQSYTVRALATHTSGLTAWIPIYLAVKSRNEIFDWILRSERSLGGKVVYSDLNFILLGLFLEEVFKQRLEFVFGDNVSWPLGLATTGYDDGFESKDTIAASEKGNEYERLTCIEQGFLSAHSKGNVFFRHEVIWGDVHDGNAYFMDGIAGHAGLFSTAEEVFKIALQFLPQYTKLLKPETCDLFRMNFTKGMNEDRSFAFQLASTEGSTAGTKMSPESFGHNGFTGTSLWIDPVKERIFVLLTNRTHHHPLPFVNINSVRRKFHDLAVDALEAR